MNDTYSEKLSLICESIKRAELVEDFVKIQILISNFFYEINSPALQKIILEKNNFYIIALENVLSNNKFLDALGKILAQHRALKEKYNGHVNEEFFVALKEVEIKNKKLVFSALSTSTSFLVNTLTKLDENNLDYTSRKIRAAFSKLNGAFKNNYSSSEIFNVLSSVFDKRFYPKTAFQLEIKNIESFFTQQKESQIFANLIIRLYFKNSRLNNLFKNIEKNKLLGKFSLISILNIRNFIRNELYEESSLIKYLGSLIDDQNIITGFVENFENNKNGRNVYNLLEISTREFKTKPTLEGDLVRLISNGNKIKEEIEKYGIENFTAFSSNIGENNAEWSNKVLINCHKLFGVITALPKAVAREWIIDVCTKEFADWTSSVHKILNKNDIDDDWEKISNFLNEESNRIEWKSTFFTPIKIKKENPEYKDKSRKVIFGIVKTMIGMMNSDGGVILVGLMEHADEVEEIYKKFVFYKNGKAFFDVSKELVLNRMDFDGIKRKIQDFIKAETFISIDTFNDLWNIEPINLKSEDGIKEITIYKINVKKAGFLIFSVKSELEESEFVSINKKIDNIWVSILKRADARTIYIDPRKHLTLSVG